MSLQATDIADLVSTTLNELGRNRFTDIASDYQQTIALKKLLKKNKTTFQSGTEIEFNLITDTSDSARWVGIGEVDVIDIKNVMTKGKIGWRHITWNWALDNREIQLNSGAGKIVDLIKTRRIAALGGAIKKFEAAFWRCPAASDTLTMLGLPFWIVKSNTAVTTNEGFNGTVPSGYTVVGNISPTTYPRWANYATQYTTVSKDDLIRKMRRMYRWTDFMPLVDEVPEYNTGDDCGIYTNYSVIGTMEEILESQNDNLGKDIASMDGEVLFRRHPIEWSKELELDTTNPLYLVNWGEFKPVGLMDWWMRETTTPQVAGQHTMTATHTDCTINTICRNRRRCGVLATDTTMGY